MPEPVPPVPPGGPVPPAATEPVAADSIVPHPVLTDYYGRETDRRAYVSQIFDQTSVDYDRIERMMGLGSGSWYRRQALLRAGLKPGMRVCDVGFGTGLVAREAVKICGDASLVTGIDPSDGMMSHARITEGVRLLQGSAESIPMPDASADFLSMGFALRHLSSLRDAFAEFSRVLAPGGRVCVLELTRPVGRLRHALVKTYMLRVVPLLAGLVSRSERTPEMWRYYWDTIEACVDSRVVVQALREAGFTEVGHHVEIGMFSEYTATRPAA